MPAGRRGQVRSMPRPASLVVALVSVVSLAVSCSDDDSTVRQDADPTTVNKESDGEGTPGVDAQTEGTTDSELTETEN